jgi:signal transduction histidine kinase
MAPALGRDGLAGDAGWPGGPHPSRRGGVRAVLRGGPLPHPASTFGADRERLEELVCSKDEFVAAVSHELRIPLTAVVRFLQLLADDEGPLKEGERHEMLAHAARGATR